MGIEAAIILAGGRSSRMGTDKAFCRLGGRTLVEIVAARLAAQVGRVAVNANGPAERFAVLGLPVLADAVGDYAGPLAGILAGLDWAIADAVGGSHLLSVSVDTPFLPDDLAARLAAAAPADGIVLATSGGVRQPVVAAWPLSIAPALWAHFAAAGPRGVGAFAARHPVATVEFTAATPDGAPYDPFVNVNTPDDLRAAEGLARRLGA